jgi:hypothetical protein
MARVQEADHRDVGRLCTSGERERRRGAAQRDDEVSPPDVDCHVTLRGGHA